MAEQKGMAFIISSKTLALYTPEKVPAWHREVLSNLVLCFFCNPKITEKISVIAIEL